MKRSEKLVIFGLILGAMVLTLSLDGPIEKCNPDYCIKEGQTLKQIGVQEE